MIFHPTPVDGAVVIEVERQEDERGFFARTFCREEFGGRGLPTSWAQSSVSFNTRRHTLRGMHYQAPPHAEGKLVRCTMGALFDVVIDLRPDSPSRLRHATVELSAGNRLLLYVPPGLAHGFLTLTDDTEVSYQITEPYLPEAGRGVRWDDPAFGIAWPHPPVVISERDRTYPDYTP